ncbi:MAG: hypothetical protein IT223_02705 [Crocinitomicaceae bacterium]|nr:hypothetical protein [Crocinitomicaceae bacterium]
MYQKTTLFHFIFLLSIYSFAQSGVAINLSGTDPAASAMLDVSSTDQGMLIPRMTATQKAAIAAPVQGLMIFQTDGDSGFWYYDGLSWTKAGDNLGSHTAASDLDMSGNKVTNLAACTSNADAANKEYVDNAVSAGGGGPVVPDTTYTLSGSKLLTVAYGGTTYTGPSDKMWAIESAVYSSYQYPVRISSINGQAYSYGYIGNFSYSGNAIYCIATPFVLPPGTTVIFDVGSGASHKGLVSIREYKIAVQ